MSLDDLRFRRADAGARGAPRVVLEGRAAPGATVVVENKSIAPYAPAGTRDAFSRGTADADGRFRVELRGAREGDRLQVAAERSGGRATTSVLDVRLQNVERADGRPPVVRQQGLRLTEGAAPGTYAFAHVGKSRAVGEPHQQLRALNTRTREAEVFTLDKHGHLPDGAAIAGRPGDVIRLATSDGVHNADFADPCGAVLIPQERAAGGTPVEPRRMLHAPAELRRVEGPLFSGAPAPGTVMQGEVGDCWLVATCDALALRCPEVIKRMIEPHDDGSFTVTFQRYDHARERYVPEKVRVSEQLYVKPSSRKPLSERLMYGSTSTGELWFPILEKAYAAWKGGYDGAHSGYPYEIYEAVFGREGRHFDLDVTSTNGLWRALSTRDRAGEVMVAWSRVASRELPFANTGLVEDHAYAVLGVEERDGERRVLLRNPWGESPWAARDSKVVKASSRGVVSMTVEDFKRYFIGLGAVAPP